MARLKSWLPLGLLVLAISAALFFAIKTVQLSADRRQIREAATTHMGQQLIDRARLVNDTQDAAAAGDQERVLDRLLEMQYEMNRLDYVANNYALAIHDSEAVPSILTHGRGLSAYAQAINSLRAAIKAADQIQPDHSSLIAAMKADFDLLLALFPQDVLLRADPGELGQASAQFCAQVQVAEVREVCQWPPRSP